MAAKKTNIVIRGVEDSTVRVTGHDEYHHAQNGLKRDGSESEKLIEVTHIKGSELDVNGGDYVDFAPPNIQALVVSVENVLSKQIENRYTKEMLEIVYDVKRENEKSKPNFNTIVTLLSKLAKLIPLANLEESAKKLLQTFIETIKGNTL